MQKRNSIREFWCLLTMPVSGVIAIISLIMRKFSGLPGTRPSEWAEHVSAPTYLISQYAYAIAYVMPFLGFWALYAQIRDQDSGEGFAFWGLMGALAGTALALPTLGVLAFAGPEFARLFLSGSPEMARILNDIALGPAMALGLPAAVLYSAGCLLLGIAVWRTGSLPKWPGIALAAHGFTLVFGFGSPVALVLSWLLFIACGTGFVSRRRLR